MAWNQYDFVSLVFGGTTYNFAPNQLVYIGNPQTEVNQILQESESGEIKVQQIDSNVRTFYEFAVRLMPESDWAIGATTMRGFSTLEDLITSSSKMHYREATAQISLEGDPVATLHTVNYWSSIFGPHPVVRKVGNGVSAVRYIGDGSTTVLFREAI